MSKLDNLVSYLKRNKKTIAVTESVTGGYLSYLLTKIPGSSKVFKLGIVAYSPEAKSKLFGISTSYLQVTEGVSIEVAKDLAEKVKKILNTDIGASIVGFAGPKAKRSMKGVIFMAVASKHRIITRELKFKGERATVRRKASYALIDFILKNVNPILMTKGRVKK
jgi:nicotinamide-nucleotide amidase